MLLRLEMHDGRAVWQADSTTKTNSDGAYRFGGLADGVYAVYTEPALESEPATNLVETGHDGAVAHKGYASQFYPEAAMWAEPQRSGCGAATRPRPTLSSPLSLFRQSRRRCSFPADGGAPKHRRTRQE